VVEERSAAGPATLEADLPVTDPPATNPPEADLPVTDPPATDPAATNQSATNPSAADTIRRGAAWISDADLLALLADLGVAASGGADEEAACAAEFELLESSESVLIESEAQIAEHIAVGPGLASVCRESRPPIAGLRRGHRPGSLPPSLRSPRGQRPRIRASAPMTPAAQDSYHPRLLRR
jgi:hypothetical protein